MALGLARKNPGNASLFNNYKQAQKAFKSSIYRDKQIASDQFWLKLVHASKNSNTKLFWSLVNRGPLGRSRHGSANRTSEEWTQFLSKHFRDYSNRDGHSSPLRPHQLI